MSTKVPTKKADERWRSVCGYEGLYEVSSYGRFRSLARKTECGVLGGKDLVPSKSNNEYLRITFSRDGISKRFLAHRVVLTAFVGPAVDNQQSRHLNGARDDNHVTNLAWGTASENGFDRTLHGTHVNNSGERHGMTRLSDDDARQIQRSCKAGVPQRTMAKQFQIGEATVSRIVNGRGWKHLRESK